MKWGAVPHPAAGSAGRRFLSLRQARQVLEALEFRQEVRGRGCPVFAI